MQVAATIAVSNVMLYLLLVDGDVAAPDVRPEERHEQTFNDYRGCDGCVASDRPDKLHADRPSTGHARGDQ
jgi:hypothetical protein